MYLIPLSKALHLHKRTLTEAFLEIYKAVFTKLKRELFGGTVGWMRALILAGPWW